MRALALGTILLCCIHISGIATLPALGQLENIVYDGRLNLTLENTLDTRVIVVDVDDRSLTALGHWPWDRRLLARIVETLFQHYKIKILGFDVLFAEPENSPDLQVLEQLANSSLKNDALFNRAYQQLAPTLQRDEIFATSFEHGPVLLGYYFNHASKSAGFSNGRLPTPLMTQKKINLQTIPFPEAKSFGANLPLLQEKSVGAGFIDMAMVDSDGVMRRLPLIQRYDNKLYAAFSVAMIGALLEQPEISLNIASEYAGDAINRGLESIALGGFQIPVDEKGSVLIPFRGNYPSFPYISALDILEKNADPELMQDAIVLLGTTAPGLLDMRATPVSAVYPGVEIHANMISGILDQTIKHRPAWVQGAQLSAALLTGAILTLLLSRLSFISTIFVYGLLLTLLFSVYYFSWTLAHTDIPIVPLIAMIMVFFALQNSYGFVAEKLTKDKLEKLFGQYVPPLVVNEMSKNPEIFSLQGEVRTMTVLFCDLRSFTSLSESIAPTALTQLINQYFTLMTSIIYKHRGTIDKYIGDAVMAFWGAPLTDGEHARHAVEAAQEMLASLHELNNAFVQFGLPPPKVGIGINTGSMHVGNMGSEYRISYTVLGDSVNLASRLENLTVRYGVNLIVGETTRNAVPTQVYRELDLVKVRGKSTAVHIYEPLGPQNACSPSLLNELAQFQQALDLYRHRQWQEAQLLFDRLLNTPGAPIIYQLYLGRCLQLLAHPPGENWDPSTVYKDK